MPPYGKLHAVPFQGSKQEFGILEVKRNCKIKFTERRIILLLSVQNIWEYLEPNDIVTTNVQTDGPQLHHTRNVGNKTLWLKINSYV